MRRAIFIVALVGVFVVVAVAILGTASANASAANGAQPLKSVTVDKGEVTLTVSATGKLAVKQQSSLSFTGSGRVQEVLVTEGQQIQAGQVLARQDDSTQQADLAKAEDGVTAATAALQKLLRPVDAGDISKAEANVKSAEASYISKASSVNPNTVKSYELQYQKAVAAVQAADYARAGAGGQLATTDPSYVQYVAKVGQASFNAEIARLQLVQSQAGSSLLSATAQITYAQALLAQVKAGSTQTEIETAQASLVTAQLQRDAAQHALDNTRLVAPFAGVVSSISAKAGAMSSGTAMVITNTGDLGATINVDEADIATIQTGQSVKMTLDALTGATLTGKVQRIADTADTSSTVITYAVQVSLDPVKLTIKPGMTVNATFVVQDVKIVLRIPNDYVKLNRTTRQSTVNLVNPDGSVTVVSVKVGVQGTEYTEVLEGLNDGDAIALITSTTTTSSTSNNG